MRVGDLKREDFPEPIIREIMSMFNKYIESTSNLFRSTNVVGVKYATEYDLQLMLFYLHERSPSYMTIISHSKEIFGLTPEDKFNFWSEVVRGNFKMFFDAVDKANTKEVIVDGQKFMI